MRRQHFAWTYLVISILCIVYGGYFAIRKYNVDDTFFVSSIIVLSIGVAMLLVYLVLYLLSQKQKKITPSEPVEPIIEEQPKVEKVVPTPRTNNEKPERDYEYVRSSSSSSSSSYDASGYVKEVGYGPILEINGNRIRDMRTNTYYRIEGSHVYCDGSGLSYEISSKKIRNVYGSYLYEISGSSINKVFGGFYASISGNYITIFDSSKKYEMTDSFNTKVLLIIAVLLFGE